jgi:hypothetical protein
MTSKVIFQLEQDDDGFPPIAVELLNATSLGGGLFQIQNAPFFTKNISYNDVVKALPTEVSEQYQFEEVIEQSRFTSLSIIILDSSMDKFLMDLLRGLDCVIEYGEFGVYRMLAVAVPDTTNYASLREQLESLEDRELLSFAELAVPKRTN